MRQSPLIFPACHVLPCLRSDLYPFKSWKCIFMRQLIKLLRAAWVFENDVKCCFHFLFQIVIKIVFSFLFHQKSVLTQKCKDQQSAVQLISSEHRPLWVSQVSENEMCKAVFTFISLCIFISTATMSSQRKTLHYTTFKWCLIM